MIDFQSTHDRLVTVGTVASAIAWHVDSVRRAIHAGRIPFVRVGREYRVKQSTLEHILAHGVPTAQSVTRRDHKLMQLPPADR